jgi:hypothetical protein
MWSAVALSDLYLQQCGLDTLQEILSGKAESPLALFKLRWSRDPPLARTLKPRPRSEGYPLSGGVGIPASARVAQNGGTFGERCRIQSPGRKRIDISLGHSNQQ